MKTIAIISQKGGSGKTTLATNLATIATQQGKSVVLVDLDKQHSATHWYNARKIDPELAHISATANLLPQILKKSQDGGADLVVIDTAPYADKDATSAARVADFVLIPCRPEFYDMMAMPSTVQIVRLTKTPHMIILNGCPPGNITNEAREELRLQGFSVSCISIPHRAGMKHSALVGQGVNEFDAQNAATGEITALFDFLTKEVNL